VSGAGGILLSGKMLRYRGPWVQSPAPKPKLKNVHLLLILLKRKIKVKKNKTRVSDR
jgi:hypothetical protein